MKSHRKAFGPYNARTASPATKARNIAASMIDNPGRTVEFYGVSEQSELGQMVLALLVKQAA